MKKLLAGIGFIGLCALCCLLPSLLVALAGITGISLGFWKWGIGLLSISLIIYIFLKRNPKCSPEKGCNCSSPTCSHK